MWERCLKRLESDISPEEISLWIQPVSVRIIGQSIELQASNDIVIERIKSVYLPTIVAAVHEVFGKDYTVEISLTSSTTHAATTETIKEPPLIGSSNLDRRFTFENFVEGHSNSIAKASAIQVAQKTVTQFNPLLLYGSTGLGKTHLLHAIGNKIKELDKDAIVCYIHSEQFVNGMINALRQNRIDEFKQKYRSVSALLIDDIQFFAGKERSQEEFFHTFNSLLEGQKRVIITCDRFPKEVNGLQTRLKSRLGWGLSVAIDPPEYETRVAILQKKADQLGFELQDPVAYYIAKQINSNVRELEGALNTLWANANFTGINIDLNFTKNALKELFNVHHRHITIDSIQKLTAQYYNIRLADILGKNRKRSIVRPRQMAMYLSKELTDKSYPEIGEAFGGRDHTTVLHAFRKIQEMLPGDSELMEAKQKIVNKLSE
ncbi:chromosomal replication initiator protein DnaA [Marinicella sp. W31]|uniref:chromosomal replication initiator protein DnaA n=1 Tax=Marinicella sp. W31 TaxID=3023713 RepID=UPI00375773B4